MQDGKKMISDYLRLNMGCQMTAEDTRRLGLLDPLLDFVVRGTGRLHHVNAVDLSDLSVGVNRFIGCQEDMVTVRLCRLDDLSRLPSRPDSYAILMSHLAYVEFAAVIQGLGARKADGLLSFMSIVFASNFNRLIEREISEVRNHFGPDVTLVDMLDPYAVLPAAFAGYLVMGDQAGMARIAPVMRHMAQVLMLGATYDSPFEWIALLA